MKTAEIRQRFLNYFEKNGHKQLPSSSLVPENDPTLLFTNAGMVQFKNVFTGNEKVDYVRATTSQRCVRAGGKHNDLENVGYTARHHTFFEMLGNFSFGDYFKHDAIKFAWEFLTVELQIPAEKLWVTVFNQDAAAADIWLKDIGIDPNRLSRIGEKDNFWSMGDVGPCGPCSEIFYDHGPEVAGGPPGTPEEDGDRYIEIWNLVFMQYERDSNAKLNPLPKPSVDTGMGLERIAAVMQHAHNNYDIDLFENLINEICRVLGVNDKKHHSVRVIADHIRSCSFLIADGVLPSNEGRGYVLRRIIRRAIRHGYQLGGQTPFFYKLVASLVDEMGGAYPELLSNQVAIETALEKEELRFAETLEQGLKIFTQKTQSLKNTVVPGELVFLLYDTYGFPVDLTADVAREKGMTIDSQGFEAHMEQQRERARSSSQFGTKGEVSFSLDEATDFIGYNYLKSQAKVVALKIDNVDAVSAVKGQAVALVLDNTPFYAEGGGQVGDYGLVSADGLEVQISDCQKLANGVFVHFGEIVDGELCVNQEVIVQVDVEARYATAANHSATHLLHAALKKVLGAHVNQKGSSVDPEKLRFDFSHGDPITRDQLVEIENLVNQEIFAKHAVQSVLMSIDQAKEAGAEALFGEKYGAEVRVVSMSDFSMELCGGTHVANTSEIGFFKIVSESGVASGVRRIEAATRRTAIEWANEKNTILVGLSSLLKTDSQSLIRRVEQLQANIKGLEQDKKALQQKIAQGGSDDVLSQTQDINGIAVLAVQMDGVDKDLLRATIDRFKEKNERGIIVLGAAIDGKNSLLAGVSKSISKDFPAGKLIQHITALADGRGGGRPDMAEGGVPNESDIEKCLNAVTSWVEKSA